MLTGHGRRRSTSHRPAGRRTPTTMITTTKEQDMNKGKTIIWGGLAAVAVAGSIGVASMASAGGGDQEVPITGSALDRASAAALAHTGGGTVTQTEVGDEESLYEVEVRLPDGSSMDVQLDKGFQVVGDKVDGDRSKAGDAQD